MSTIDRLRTMIEPIVDDLGLELFDLEFAGSLVSVTIDRVPAPDDGRPGAHPVGIDLGDITAVTRAVSRALDEQDPIDGAFTLEVSSPGLERSLRTPRHFERAIGQVLAVKTVPNFAAGRRLKGELTAADADGIDLELADGSGESAASVRIAYVDIEKARTVFDWGPEPKPAKPPRTPPTKDAKTSQTSKAAKTSKASKASKAPSQQPAKSTKQKPPQQKKVPAS